MNTKSMLVSVEESDSTVACYDSHTGSEISRIKVGFWPHEIAITRDGKKAYVSNFGIKDYDEKVGKPGASISVIDLEKHTEIGRLYTFRNKDEYFRFQAPHSVVLSHDESELYVNVEKEDQLLVFNIELGSITEKITLPWPSDFELPDINSPLPTGTHSMIIDPTNSRRLWVASGKGGVTEVNLDTLRPNRTIHIQGAARGLTFVDNRLVISASNMVYEVDTTTLTIIEEYGPWDDIRQLLYTEATPDKRYLLAPAVWSGQILRIDRQTKDVERITVGADPIHIVISPDSMKAWISHGRSKFISEIDIATFKVLKNIQTRGGPNGLALVPLKNRPKRKVFRCGAVIPLSGKQSVEGQDLRLGYQLWMESVNEAGGLVAGSRVFNVEMIFIDSKSSVDSEEIKQLTRSLIEKTKVNIVFGGYPSPPNLYSGEIANNSKIPFITASGAAGVIYQNGWKWVFGLMTSAKGFLNDTFRYLNNLDPKPSSVLFLADDDPAAKQDALTTAAFVRDELDINILTDNTSELPRDEDTGTFIFPHLNTEFDDYLDVIETLNPDILAITGHLPESVAIVRQMSDRGIEPKAVVFSVGPAIPAFGEQLGKLANQMTGTAMWSENQLSYGHDRFVTPKNFAQAFYDRYSRQCSYLAAGAVACGIALEQAIRSSNSISNNKIRDSLSHLDIETFYSRVHFDQNNLNYDRKLLTIQLQATESGKLEQVPLFPRELAGKGEKMVWPFKGWD